jgi:hypothetical protein
MKVYAVAVNLDDLKKSKAEALKNFPIPMPRAELEEISEFLRGQGVNRCDWARQVLLASFAQLRQQQAG